MLLLRPALAASTSLTPAALTADGPGLNSRHLGVLSFLLLESRRHTVVSQLAAVVDGKGVCPWHLTPACPVSAISASDLGEKDEELPGQLVEKQTVEEGVVLLAPGAEEQHLDKQLRQLLTG